MVPRQAQTPTHITVPWAPKAHVRERLSQSHPHGKADRPDPALWPKPRLEPAEFRLVLQLRPYPDTKRVVGIFIMLAKALSVAMGTPVELLGCVAIHNGGLNEPEAKFAHHFNDVWVVTRWNIVRTLRKAEPVLTPVRVEAIYAVARRSNTWV